MEKSAEISVQDGSFEEPEQPGAAPVPLPSSGNGLVVVDRKLPDWAVMASSWSIENFAEEEEPAPGHRFYRREEDEHAEGSPVAVPPPVLYFPFPTDDVVHDNMVHDNVVRHDDGHFMDIEIDSRTPSEPPSRTSSRGGTRDVKSPSPRIRQVKNSVPGDDDASSPKSPVPPIRDFQRAKKRSRVWRVAPFPTFDVQQWGFFAVCSAVYWGFGWLALHWRDETVQADVAHIVGGRRRLWEDSRLWSSGAGAESQSGAGAWSGAGREWPRGAAGGKEREHEGQRPLSVLVGAPRARVDGAPASTDTTGDEHPADSAFLGGTQIPNRFIFTYFSDLFPYPSERSGGTTTSPCEGCHSLPALLEDLKADGLGVESSRQQCGLDVPGSQKDGVDEVQHVLLLVRHFARHMKGGARDSELMEARREDNLRADTLWSGFKHVRSTCGNETRRGASVCTDGLERGASIFQLCWDDQMM